MSEKNKPKKKTKPKLKVKAKIKKIPVKPVKENNTKQHSNVSIFESRVTVVLDLLLSGCSRSEICQFVSTNKELNWNVDTRQIDRYISEANKHLALPIEEDRDFLRSGIAKKQNFLYKKMVQTGDYRGASLALDKLSVLIGVNAPIKTLSITKTALQGLSDEELDKEYSELEAQLD